MKTTIQISRETMSRLSSHKKFSKESYDEVLTGILDEYEDDTISSEDVASIKRGLDDVVAGRTISIADVKKRYGLK